MKIQQLSLFAENKPGTIIAPCRLLAREGIDIRALSLADTQRFGILRMIVSDCVKVTEVLAVEVPDRPGGLAEILAIFEGTSINIEFMYAFPFGSGDKAILIFRFGDPDAAIERLQASGINVLESGAILNK